MLFERLSTNGMRLDREQNWAMVSEFLAIRRGLTSEQHGRNSKGIGPLA